MKRAKPKGVRSLLGRYDRRHFSITLNETQRDAIDALLARGLFGLTRTDVVRRMIDAQLQEHARNGWLPTRRT